MILESCKKDISADILLTRDRKTRLDLIYKFLSYDLDKHELLEHAGVLAVSNHEEAIIKDLQSLYSYREGIELIDKIRDEISLIQKFINTIKKAIKYPDSRTFYERRIIQEISKYVVEQARLYNTV